MSSDPRLLQLIQSQNELLRQQNAFVADLAKTQNDLLRFQYLERLGRMPEVEEAEEYVHSDKVERLRITGVKGSDGDTPKLHD